MSEIVAPAPVLYQGAELSRLSIGAASLLRWLARWFEQSGEALFPSTPYLARKQHKTERTIYRWLAELRSAGLIQTETTVGVERRITPQVPLAECPQRRRRAVRCGAVSGVPTGVLSGVPPYPPTHATDSDSTATDRKKESLRDGSLVWREAHQGAVAELAAAGVKPQIAAELVHLHGEQSCREQLAALPRRKASNPVAVLVASIRGQWAIPSAARAEVQNRQVKARRIAADAQHEQERQITRQRLGERLEGLSVAAREVLERQARALIERERPVVARMMAGKAVGAAVLRETMLRILGGGEANGKL